MPVDLWRAWTCKDPAFQAFVRGITERALELRQEAVQQNA